MSLLKGFTSLFDWMFPKTLDESLEGLDESLQHLYDKMNWGKYHNPSWNTAVDVNRQNDILQQTYVYKDGGTVSLQEDMQTTLTTSSQFLDEMLKLADTYGGSRCFQPYAYYNEDMDAIETYFKDETCYTKTLNNNIELHISFETGEVVGMNILNVQKLIQHKGHFQ